jgi:hypothetical protein
MTPIVGFCSALDGLKWIVEVDGTDRDRIRLSNCRRLDGIVNVLFVNHTSFVPFSDVAAGLLRLDVPFRGDLM